MKTYNLSSVLCDKDIIPNMIATYPKEAFNSYTADSFYEVLEKKHCNIICYHITRLTQGEITDIKEKGLSLGGKNLLYQKVNNLPSCCDWVKDELIKHINTLRETQATGALCAVYGYLDLKNDTTVLNIFSQNWGGESIYNYYDEGDNFQNQHFKAIHETLQRVSIPCLLILRIDIQKFREGQFGCLYEKLQYQNTKAISGSLYITKEPPQVLDIVDLSAYNAFGEFKTFEK